MILPYPHSVSYLGNFYTSISTQSVEIWYIPFYIAICTIIVNSLFPDVTLTQSRWGKKMYNQVSHLLTFSDLIFFLLEWGLILGIEIQCLHTNLHPQAFFQFLFWDTILVEGEGEGEGCPSCYKLPKLAWALVFLAQSPRGLGF